MTIAAFGATRRDGAELTRWGGSLAVVLLLHGAVLLYLTSQRAPFDAGGAPPEVVMIDLAPLPAPTPPEPAPPEPVVEPQPQPQVKPAPPPPPQPEIELPKVEPSPAPTPAVVLPKPPPKAKPKPVERPPQAEPERPPPPAAATVAPSPTTAPPTPTPNPAIRTSWQAEVAGWLARYKRYPRLAQEQRQEGTAYLRFTIDRQGRVLASQIEKGSGFSLLDEEVVALIQRAQPLPAPPPEVPGERIELTVPVQFSIRPGMR
jgi:protein TonB